MTRIRDRSDVAGATGLPTVLRDTIETTKQMSAETERRINESYLIIGHEQIGSTTDCANPGEALDKMGTDNPTP